MTLPSFLDVSENAIAVCKSRVVFQQSDYVCSIQSLLKDRVFAAVTESTMLVLYLRFSIFDMKSQGHCLDWDKHNYQAKWRNF